MNESSYTITTDPAQKLVRISLIGHWTATIAEQFGREVHEKYRGMRSHGVKAGEYLTYIDGTRYAIQAQDTAALYAGLVADPNILSRKIAFVMPGALARLQITRVAPRDNHRFFSSEAEALDWLLADDDQKAEFLAS